MERKTREVTITAYPYATQYGTIDVPVNIKEEEMAEYLREHWNKVRFNEPDPDYAGTEFEIEYEDE